MTKVFTAVVVLAVAMVLAGAAPVSAQTAERSPGSPTVAVRGEPAQPSAPTKASVSRRVTVTDVEIVRWSVAALILVVAGALVLAVDSRKGRQAELLA